MVNGFYNVVNVFFIFPPFKTFLTFITIFFQRFFLICAWLHLIESNRMESNRFWHSTEFSRIVLFMVSRPSQHRESKSNKTPNSNLENRLTFGEVTDRSIVSSF